METTRDAFLGGQLILEQPCVGYRAGQDPVLLAAAVPIRRGQSFVDLGCGVGTLSLCLSQRARRSLDIGELQGLGLEIDPDLSSLAKINAQRHDFTDFSVLNSDFFETDPGPVDWVLSNPPFFSSAAGRVPPNPQRRQGRHSDRDLRAWLDKASAWVRPRGYLGLILTSEQVPEALASLQPGFGGFVLLPLLGSETKPQAERCLLFARQGSKSPFALAAPLTIRDAQGQLTPQAQALLNKGAALPVPLIK